MREGVHLCALLLPSHVSYDCMTDLVVRLEIGERRIFVFVASEGLPGNKAGRGEREGETEEEKDGVWRE